MSTKELQDQIKENMSAWQKIENAGVASAGALAEKTSNPIVKLVMEIIQRDSQTHHRVQQMIVDSLEGGAITLTPEELAGVWGEIEKHIALERKTIDLANASLEAIGDRKGMVVQKYLLEYLRVDEDKHNDLLDRLETIKKGLYP